MRSNLIVALLTVVATLLGVQVAQSLRPGESGSPIAFGQGVGATSGFTISTVVGQGGETWCYVFEEASRTLACYSSKGLGLEIKGVRNLTADLKVRELTPRQRLSVEDVEAILAGKK